MDNNIDNKQLTRVLHWVLEREEIRKKKEAGQPKPWSHDEKIAGYRYCNVNRQDDPVTRYIQDKVLFQIKNPDMVWHSSIVCRFMNLPSTFEKLGFPWEIWDGDLFIRLLDEAQANKETIFNGAYMVRGSTGADAGKPKHHYLVDRTFTPIWEQRFEAPFESNSLQTWSDWFSSFFGMGTFMRNQALTDLKYTDLLKGAIDWETFVEIGPGTKRGLNRLFGRGATAPGKDSFFKELLYATREALVLILPELEPTLKDPNNVCNIMCETDKYSRLFEDGGKKPKQKYNMY